VARGDADSAYLYEAALAARELGDPAAPVLLARLAAFGDRRLENADQGRYTAVDEYHGAPRADAAGGHYARGLALLAKGSRADASRELREALRVHPNHVWARRRLAEAERE
jgi:hypothetical protein